MRCTSRDIVRVIVSVSGRRRVDRPNGQLRRFRLLVRLHAHLLRLHFALLAQLVRLALVVMVDDLQPEVRVALDERRPNVRNVVRPAATVRAEHGVGVLVMLQPGELVQPVGPEAAALAAGRGRRRAGGGIAAAGARRRRVDADRDRGQRANGSGRHSRTGRTDDAVLATASGRHGDTVLVIEARVLEHVVCVSNRTSTIVLMLMVESAAKRGRR